ncbi:hypothetical protein B0O80DRAFT_19590 [Mortierella sp. GBAus27b]|nr:hypothetical protein B0O80DRAFT_19590 [Mortierella sp. GBAus27b]
MSWLFFTLRTPLVVHALFMPHPLLHTSPKCSCPSHSLRVIRRIDTVSAKQIQSWVFLPTAWRLIHLHHTYTHTHQFNHKSRFQVNGRSSSAWTPHPCIKKKPVHKVEPNEQ